MKLSKAISIKPAGASDSLGKQLALEFTRIAKLTESGKADEAWRAANDLYAKHPGEATPNFIIALILLENGQQSDALAYAEAAVKFAPDSAINKVFLGRLYVQLEMIEFATDILRSAFAMDNTLFQAPFALASYYFKSGQGGLALPFFEQALGAAPIASRAAIRLQRADCLRALGRVLEAEDDYKSIMGEPQLRVSALVAAALLQKNDSTSNYANLVRKELDRSDLTDKDRSSLLLCLGGLHENGGDYDNAFLSYDRSKKLLNVKFNMENFDSQVDESIGVLTQDIFEKLRKFGHGSDKPIFIVGMPRSGTTLTEQIIAAHSQAEGVGELSRMGRMARNFSRRDGLQQTLDNMAEMDPERWKDIPQQYLNLVTVLAPGARHTVDKMPHNFLQLGFIHLCFPNAKIIHCKRNPLDTFISTFQNSLSTFHSYSFDQVVYGEYYATYLRLMEHWKAVLPDNIYESQYENLTANPEFEVRSILDFLGLPWEEDCLKFNKRESTVRTVSRLQVRNPINTGSVARWRKYEKHLGPIINVLKRAGVQY